MEITAAIAVIVAAIAPFVTATLTRPDMDPTRKRVIAGGIAVTLGVIVAVAMGMLEGVPLAWQQWAASILVSVAIVVGLAQGFYAQFKPAVQTVEARWDIYEPRHSITVGEPPDGVVADGDLNPATTPPQNQV